MARVARAWGLDSACKVSWLSIYSVIETAGMAKPKSEDKRNSILSAATQVFAERGLAAPTAAITSAPGIAEGSLFTYFKTKDELSNALYRELKLELPDSTLAHFPPKHTL